MTSANPMICPRCRIPMNHHAEKPLEPRGADEAARVDRALGCQIEEVHTCPQCGDSASRRAPAGT